MLVPNGAIASVVCNGTNIDPLDSGASGPAPGTAAYNPSWYAVTNIYLDPVGGSDTNAGTSSSFPVKTMSEVIRRYGTSSPLISDGQHLTIHQLSSQQDNDVFAFNPIFQGDNAFLWDGLTSATPVDAPFSPTTVTPQVQSAVGNQLELIGNLPADIAINLIIQNTSKNSFAIVISVVGGTATVSQPLAALTPNAGTHHPTEDNTWVNTDTYQLLTPLQCNWINPSPNGAGGRTSSWIQGVEIIDTSGFSGSGSWATKPLGALLTFWLCVFDPGWLIFDGSSASQNVAIPSSETTPINGISLWNCASGPGPAQSGGAGVSSTVCNNVYVSGGQVNFGYFIDCMLDNDVGLHTSVFSGETLINFYDLAPGGGVYIGTGGSSPFINGGTTRLLPGAFHGGPRR